MRISSRRIRNNRLSRWCRNWRKIRSRDKDLPETKKTAFKGASKEAWLSTQKTNSSMLKFRNWMPKWIENKSRTIGPCRPSTTLLSMIMKYFRIRMKSGCPRVPREPWSKMSSKFSYCMIAADKWPKGLKRSKINWQNEWNIKTKKKLKNFIWLN